MSVYSNYLRGVIIQEFHNQFEVQYSNNMYPNLVYYTDARTALSKNGFTFREVEGGFALDKDGKTFVDMQMGDFSAVFLNAWISMSQKNLTLFPVGFGKAHPKSFQGKLAEYSERFHASLGATGLVTPQQADVGAIELFLSDQIVDTGENSIFRVNSEYVQAISRVDFEVDGVVTFDDTEDESDDEAEKKPQVVAPKPFYYVVAMERKGKILPKLPTIWRNKIVEDGLSWEYDAEKGRLYVSNTVGAFNKLPPAPHHICGLPKLEISLNTWKEVEASFDEPAFTVPTANAGNTEWEKITNQFMLTPTMTTYEAFRDSDEIFKAYEHHKKDSGYKMGSNKNPMTDSVRKVIRGEDKAVTWTEFTELLSASARPNDTKGIMILLFKIRLYIEQTRDGKVYVSK